jgi:hypothetical protein
MLDSAGHGADGMSQDNVADLTADAEPEDGGNPDDGTGKTDVVAFDLPHDVSDEVPVPVDVSSDGNSDVCEVGNGCFLEPCIDESDCFAGLCILHLGAMVCSVDCADSACPDGWACKKLDGVNGPGSFCVSNHPTQCRPCQTSADCTAEPGALANCLDYGPVGYFCGSGCGPDEYCPDGYVCEEALFAGGITAPQCILAEGECECTEYSITSGSATSCFQDNEWGNCPGTRECTVGGLTDCDAKTPEQDICNGINDDCDGATDEVPPGEHGLCDDSNPCTQDTCGGIDGCQFEPLDGESCDDFSKCTSDDQCQGGQCLGTPVLCDDQNQCTDDTCDLFAGCQYLATAGPCDDGDMCTLDDVCKGGVCSPGLALVCEDDNPCTQNTCEAILGCLFVPASKPCDDGNVCTIGDVCSEGDCASGAVNLPCDDGNSCTLDSCDPVNGCINEAKVGSCDDGNQCTENDICKDGECVSGSVKSCCDDNVCTDDLCDFFVGCVNQEISGLCDDGNSCTEDSCDAKKGCQYKVLYGDCDDGNACTVGDGCVGGECIPSGPLNCNDGNWCTEDFCDKGTGCINNSVGGICPGGTCQAGECVKVDPTNCDDWNSCTIDTYNEQLGCVYSVDNDAGCDDGNDCTTGDHCFWGTCQSNGIKECNDQNQCTEDSCHPDVGCVHVPALNGCDDGNPCTEDECTPVDGCVHSYNAVPCSDGDPCTLEDICSQGVCAPGEEMLTCEDNNSCTTDFCQAKTGCVHAANELPCDDDDPCTIGDKCSGGGCAGGLTIQVCDDENPCTDDSCEPGQGCQYIPTDASCDDENVCTLIDQCLNGECIGSQNLNCDDGNVCTDDSCDAVFGCQQLHNAAPCPNGVCSNGMCDAVCLDCCAEPYFRDHFSADKGWEYGPEWQRGTALSSGGQSYGGPDPGTDHTGSGDNYLAGVSIGGNASTGIHSYFWLTSPVVNTSGAQNLHLLFWRWLNSDYASYMTNAVDIYNGTQWIRIWETGSSPGVMDNSWMFINHNVQQYSNSQFRVRFGFQIGSSGVFTVSSWNVDDVTIIDLPVGTEPPVCCEFPSDCHSLFPGVGDCQQGQCFF